MKLSFGSKTFIAMTGLMVLTGCIGPQTPAPVTMYGAKPGAGSAGVHTVSSGDTLYSISKRYNVVMRDVVVTNHMSAPFLLNAGQRIKLPPPQEYRVRAGDTLYEISRIFATSQAEIASLNNMRAPYVVRTGQILKLPSVRADVAPAVIKPAAPVQVAPVQRLAATRPAPAPAPAPAPQVKPPVEAAPKLQTASAAPRAKITAQTPARSSSKFLEPVKGRVISTYGPKADGLHNDGVNIAAAKGTPVAAAENGVVVYAGNELKGSGNLVLIRHEDRWMTAYAHMDNITVKRGDVIKRGQTIGAVGQTGSVDSPQLHFEVRRGTEAINPTRYLDS